VNIQKDNVREGFSSDGYETFLQSRRKKGFVAFGFQPVLEEFAILGIVIHHKNPLLHSASFGRHRVAGVESRAPARDTISLILSS
jgi:hypothetical protein